jgi:uncharacterized OsmC-like protein
MRGHEIIADEPEEKGGADEGGTPMEIFLAGLCACTAMTLRMYANLKKMPLETIEIDAELAWVTPEEWADWPEGDERKRLPRILRNIRVTGPLSDQQKERLEYIARRCPVHRVVTENPVIVDSIENPR